MTPERGVAPNELSRLEALWDSARGLTPNERDELLEYLAWYRARRRSGRANGAAR